MYNLRTCGVTDCDGLAYEKEIDMEKGKKLFLDYLKKRDYESLQKYKEWLNKNDLSEMQDNVR